MKESGFYIIKDQFFLDMSDPYLKGNKEEKRPHYYCFHDKRTDMCWMIPMSSRISKYAKIMQEKIAHGGRCDTLYIAKLDDGRQSVFLIQDMFPVTENYIEREYTIGKNHMVLTSEQTIKEVNKRARRVLGLLMRGYQLTPTQPDIFSIMEKLLNKTSASQ